MWGSKTHGMNAGYPYVSGVFHVSGGCGDVWLSLGGWAQKLERWAARGLGEMRKFTASRKTFHTTYMQALSSCSKSIKHSKAIEFGFSFSQPLFAFSILCFSTCKTHRMNGTWSVTIKEIDCTGLKSQNTLLIYKNVLFLKHLVSVQTRIWSWGVA